jgi:hypothetical protein
MREDDGADNAPVTNGFRLVGETRESIKRLNGFEKHHFVPPRADDYHNAWVGKIAENDIRDEIAAVHDRAKRIQGWKRKDIASSLDNAEGLLETPAWSYRLHIALHPEEKGYVRWNRTLETSANVTERIGSEWDLIFPAEFTRLEIHPRTRADVPALIDRFEERGVHVEYPPDGTSCRLPLHELSGHVDVEPQLIRVAVDMPSAPGTLALSVSRLIGTTPDGAPLFLLG